MADGEENCGDSFIYKPSFVLIAIDTHPSMFIKSEDNLSPFETAISACYEVVDSLILAQNKRSWTPFGIVLAQDDSKATFIDFNNNILESIKLLKKESLLSNEELRDKYERKSHLDLAGFFLFCRKKFKEVSAQFYKRNMIYITTDDNPIQNDQEKFAVLNEAKNFDANDIIFEMVTMNSNFNYKLFYNELYSLFKLSLVEILIDDKEGMLEKLSSSIIFKYYKRRLNFFPFINDHLRFLKVVQKNYIRQSHLYNNCHVTTNEKVVKNVSKAVSDNPNVSRLKFEADSIEFDMQEQLEIKNNDLPIGYTLIHVSNKLTETGFVLTNSYLLELDPKEELKFFDSFWQYCTDKNKVLICARKLKYLDKIRFVELIPQLASNTKHFLVKLIPFANEIAYPPTALKVEMDSKYSTDQLKVTKDLIDQLSFEYYPKMLANPSYAKKEAFVRAKLLDEAVDEDIIEDVTLSPDGIDNEIVAIDGKFNALFGLDGGSPEKKRKASGIGGRGRAKKVTS